MYRLHTCVLAFVSRVFNVIICVLVVHTFIGSSLVFGVAGRSGGHEEFCLKPRNAGKGIFFFFG